MPPKRAASSRAASEALEGEPSTRPQLEAPRPSPIPEIPTNTEVEEDDLEEGASVLSGRDTPAPSIGGVEDLENLRMEAERLRGEIAARRLREDIQNLRIEAAGGTPGQYVDIPGTQLPSRKRAATSQGSSEALKQLKLATPPSFDGKSIKGLQKYDNGWKAHFRAMPRVAEDDYGARIAGAATHLSGVAMQAWVRETREFDRWEDFIQFLRSTISDPATRKSEALMSLATKRQKTEQSVRDLLAEIEQLEEDIPPMSEEERKAWTLLNALTPALRAEVIRDNKEITSREQVLASAQRHEEISRAKTKAESPREPRQPQFKKNGGGSTPNRGRPAPKPQGDSSKGKEIRPPFTGDCYNCGKKGHKERDCRSAPKNKSRSPKGKDKSKN